MRKKLQNELLFINVLVILLIIVITLFPSNVLRIILGLPSLLFFPGYTLTAALFPQRNRLDSTERVALSFVVSLAVVPLIALILNYTPWGVRLYPILLSVTIFILVTSLIAWHRQRRLAEAERFTVSFHLSLAPWRGQGLVDKVLSIVLIATVVVFVGTLVYAIAIPRVGEKFTEFYILGLEGKAIDYPRKLKVGEQVGVTVGIINREHETVIYWVKVRIDGIGNNQVEPLELGHDEKWEEIVSFTPRRAGDSQKVEFLLYKDKESEPCLAPLHFLIDVKE